MLDWSSRVTGSGARWSRVHVRQQPGADELLQLAFQSCTELPPTSTPPCGFAVFYLSVYFKEASRIVITCFNITVTIMCFTLSLKFITAPINHIFTIMCKNICLDNDGTVRPATTRCPAESTVWLICFPSLFRNNDFSDSFKEQRFSS